MNENTFTVGQEWTYEAREFELKSTLIITKIDVMDKKQKIIHIYVKGLKMKNALSETGFNDHIVHLPYDEKSLRNCLVELKEVSVELPSFKEGYMEWFKMFETGKAGVFQIPLADAIEYLEEHFN